MSTTATLEKIAGHRKKVDAQGRDDYEALVVATHAGAEIDPAEAIRIMDAIGRKSPMALANDVAKIQRGKELDALVVTLPALESENAKVLAEIDAVNAKLATAKAEHKAALENLNVRLGGVNARLSSAMIAKSDRAILGRICQDPSTKRIEQGLTSEALRLRVEIQDLERALLPKDNNSPGHRLKMLEFDLKQNPADKASRQKHATILADEIEPMKKKLAALIARRDEIAREQQANDQAQRLPSAAAVS